MNVRFRRKLNFWWALVSILIVGSAFAIILISTDSENHKMIWIDFLIEGGGSIAVFWCFYLIRFCFSKTRYPFATVDASEYHSGFGRSIAQQGWLWIVVIPVIAAILIPAVYFISMAITDNSFASEDHIARIILFATICVLTSLNNVSYILIVKRKGQEITDNFDVRPFD